MRSIEVMRAIVLSILLMSALATTGSAQECFQIRGRAVLYRGDSFFSIWHVGTDPIFIPANEASANLVCKYVDCVSGDKQPALFADFTICPTRRYIPGAAQPAIVKAVQHPHVVPEWPPSVR